MLTGAEEMASPEWLLPVADKPAEASSSSSTEAPLDEGDIIIEGADEIEDFWRDGDNEDDIVDSQLLNSALESMNDDAAEISGGGPVFPRAEAFEGASKAQFSFEPACDAMEL
ncbi:hypothetical protein FOZ62_014352, partial [Perkinsus olseni]